MQYALLPCLLSLFCSQFCFFCLFWCSTLSEGNWNINQNGDYVITFNELTEQATIAPYVAPSSSSTGVSSSSSSSSSTGPSVVSSFQGLKVVLWTPGRKLLSTASDVVQYPCTDAGNGVFQCADVSASCGDRFLFADTASNNPYHRIYAQPTGEYTATDTNYNDRVYDSFKFTQGPGTYYLEVDAIKMNLTKIVLVSACLCVFVCLNACVRVCLCVSVCLSPPVRHLK